MRNATTIGGKRLLVLASSLHQARARMRMKGFDDQDWEYVRSSMNLESLGHCRIHFCGGWHIHPNYYQMRDSLVRKDQMGFLHPLEEADRQELDSLKEAMEREYERKHGSQRLQVSG